MKILLVIGLTLLLACSDDQGENLEVRGVVLMYDTKQPVADKNVVIELGDGVDIVTHSFKNPLKDSATSDSNGEFTFKVKLGRMPYYMIKLSSPGYTRANVPSSAVPSYAAVVEAKLVFDTLFIGRSAGLRLTVKNDVPRDGDVISVVIPHNNPYQPGSDFIFYKYDDRQAMSTMTTMTPTASYQFLSALNTEVEMIIQVARGEEFSTTRRVISLQDQITVDYEINY